MVESANFDFVDSTLMPSSVIAATLPQRNGLPPMPRRRYLGKRECPQWRAKPVRKRLPSAVRDANSDRRQQSDAARQRVPIALALPETTGPETDDRACRATANKVLLGRVLRPRVGLLQRPAISASQERLAPSASIPTDRANGAAASSPQPSATGSIGGWRQSSHGVIARAFRVPVFPSGTGGIVGWCRG